MRTIFMSKPERKQWMTEAAAMPGLVQKFIMLPAAKKYEKYVQHLASVPSCLAYVIVLGQTQMLVERIKALLVTCWWFEHQNAMLANCLPWHPPLTHISPSPCWHCLMEVCFMLL